MTVSRNTRRPTKTALTKSKSKAKPKTRAQAQAQTQTRKKSKVSGAPSITDGHSDGSSSASSLPIAIRRDLEVHREELATQNEELRRANLELLTAKERYAQLYDGAPIPYFTLDGEGKIIEVNHAGARLLEVSSRSFVFGRSFDEIVVPSSRETFRSFCRAVLQLDDPQHVVGRFAQAHETVLLVGVRRFPVHIEAARLATSPREAHCLLCVSDASDRPRPKPQPANDSG